MKSNKSVLAVTVQIHLTSNVLPTKSLCLRTIELSNYIVTIILFIKNVILNQITYCVDPIFLRKNLVVQNSNITRKISITS